MTNKTKEELQAELEALKTKIAVLEKNKEYYQLIAENTSDNIAITTFDLKAKYLYVSPSVKQVLDYEPEELIGKSFFDFIHPDDKKLILPILKKYLYNVLNKVLNINDPQLSEVLEFRFKDKAGKWHNMQSSVNFIERNLLTITRDITKEKQIQEQLLAENIRFQTTMDSLDAVVYVADMNTQELLYLNKLGKKLFKGNIGDKCYEILQNGKSEVCDFCTNHLLLDNTGKPKKTLVWEFQNTVTKEWYQLRDKAIKWPDGRIVRLQIATNITSQKSTEKKLEDSYNTIKQERNMFIEGPVIAFKWRNSKGWPVEYVSPNVKKILGYSEEEMISGDTPYINIVVPDDIQRVANEVAKHSENGSHSFTHQPYRIKRKDGEIIWVVDYTTIIRDENGEITHFLGYILDITVREKAEIALKLALDKAKESDQLKNAFLQNISHEIRTPMNGILGFISLLKNTNLSETEQKTYIDIINTSSNRMLSTLNDLMDISKLETGQMKLNLSSININEELKNIYDLFKPEVEAKGMILNISPSLPIENVYINTDHEKLYAIINNLIKNAIKYSYKGSIDFGYTIKGEHLEFCIKDTGIGINKARHHAIFERFVQAEIEDIKVWEGSGLGLSISKEYVDMMEGKIWVESEEDKGSQFFFTIPYIKSKKELLNVSKPDINQTKSLNNLCILIADDEDIADKFLSVILKNISKKILHAKTGSKAIELCKNNSGIDLVLMDIKMPDMDGYEATRKIREFNKDVKIIAQTAYALAGDMEKAISAGCNDYISKPINRNELLELIEKVIG